MSTSGTLLTGVGCGYFEDSFTQSGSFVLCVRFQIVPADIEDGLVKSGFSLGTIREIFPIAILPGLGLASHL